MQNAISNPKLTPGPTSAAALLRLGLAIQITIRLPAACHLPKLTGDIALCTAPLRCYDAARLIDKIIAEPQRGTNLPSYCMQILQCHGGIAIHRISN